MHAQASRLTKVRFFASAALLYAASLACIGFAIKQPGAAAASSVQSEISTQNLRSKTPPADFISGKPVRIIIPSRHIDLPVIPGTYQAATDSWTLSGYDAQFDTASKPANNSGGLTFIYGHNNKYVFGALRHAAPDIGAEAILKSKDGRTFTYTFEKSWSVSPDDRAVLNYHGPPVMLVQTCTGSLNEWRTMYLFTFEKVS
jgi:LPXTG-site transpeptidase (sortase) family protein